MRIRPTRIKSYIVHDGRIRDIQDHDLIHTISTSFWARSSNAHQISNSEPTSAGATIGKNSERGASYIGGKSTTVDVSFGTEIKEDKCICQSTSTREGKSVRKRQTSISFRNQNGFHAREITIQIDMTLLDSQQQQRNVSDRNVRRQSLTKVGEWDLI